MKDSFLKPLEQITKAKPSNSLYSKIEQAVFENKLIPLQSVALIAASILLLLFVNIYALKSTSRLNSNSGDTEYVDQIINDFQIY